jgi:uncharacterized protein YodC (DUF2158 family)
MTIDVGDVVRLKSGSPTMTVEWVEDGEAYCVWFDGKKQTGSKFQVSSLTK